MMKETRELSPEAQRSLGALQAAVREALDRKRRLGHYAVVWRNGRIEYLDWRDDKSEPLA
jgi:hypothetical protein